MNKTITVPLWLFFLLEFNSILLIVLSLKELL
jgi:hypothetical protein